MAVAQAWFLRPDLGGVEGRETLAAVVRMVLAAAALGGTAYAVWWGLDEVFGRALVAQAVAVGGGIAAGVAVYAAAVWILRIEEARQIWRLVSSRFRGGGETGS
jgi:hypothetical protein